MKNREQTFTCAQAREIDLVNYLKAIGYEPKKIRNNDYWYISPLRFEKTASFKINRKLNCWYDHGLGQGGNLIDFGIQYHNCTIPEFLQRLNGNFSFHTPASSLPIVSKDCNENRIEIIVSKPVQSFALLCYLRSRNIPMVIADRYCNEVTFEMNCKTYYSIGFLNDEGGYELRNAYCKNSSSPKGITTFKNGCKKIAVFEGFFDFLSFLFLIQNTDPVEWDFCILNSLSFFQKAIPFLAQYQSVHLFFDNDNAGQNCSRLALSISKTFIDESGLYKNYKDLNDWIVKMGKFPYSPVFRFPP